MAYANFSRNQIVTTSSSGQHTIGILFICKICGFVVGFVDEDEMPINYRSGYFSLTEEQRQKIPHQICSCCQESSKQVAA